MPNYGHGDNSYLVYGNEVTPGTPVTPDKQFGLITEDIQVPNPNPKTPLAAAGAGRRPWVHADEHKDYVFDVPFHVRDADAPFEAALGVRTTTVENATLADEYTKDLFTLADILATLTIEHGAQDLALIQTFDGAKADLNLQSSKNESLRATMPVTAAKETHDTAAASFPNAPTVPVTEPYRFSDISRVEFIDAADDTTVLKNVQTLDSHDISVNNGLEGVPHGGSGRESFSVVENENAGRLEASLGVTADGTAFFKRAADDEARINVEIDYTRQSVTGTIVDGVLIRLLDCEVLDAPMPRPGSGRIMQDVSLGPLDVELEIRTPP